MADNFEYDVFLSHSSKDKVVVRGIAERLRKDGLRVWFDEWVLKAGDSIPAKVEEGLEHSRVLVLCMSANAFGSDWAQLEVGTFRFRDPLNRERRFIPLRLDDTPVKGSFAQFLYIDWLLPSNEHEYAKLLQACRHPATWAQPSEVDPNKIRYVRRITNARRNEWKRLRSDFEAEARKYSDLKLLVFLIGNENAFPNVPRDQANYMINLWQYYGDGDEARVRLASAEFTKFGIMGADITAYAVILGKETDLFCRIASRAGSLLPDDIDRVILDNVRKDYEKLPGSIVVANRNPLAKWLNLLLMATVSAHPERFQSGTLSVDPFAASLTAFDVFLNI